MFVLNAACHLVPGTFSLSLPAVGEVLIWTLRGCFNDDQPVSQAFQYTAVYLGANSDTLVVVTRLVVSL